MTDAVTNLSDADLRDRLQALQSAHHQLSDQQDRYIRNSPSPSRAWMSEEYKELQTAMERYNEQIAAIYSELRRRGSS